MCIGSSLLAAAQTAAADSKTQANVSSCTKAGFFGLVPWYQYLGKDLVTNGVDGACEVKCFRLFDNQASSECGSDKSDIPLVLLAIIDDLLRIAGLVAVGFVFYGAFQYTASQGSPDATAKAQSTIINALLGTAIAIMAVIFVSFLGKKLGG